MSLQPVNAFRTLTVVVVISACGLAGALLTPRFRAGPPAEQPSTPDAVPQSPSAEDPGNEGWEQVYGELPKGTRPFDVDIPSQATVRGGFVLPRSCVDVAWVEKGEEEQWETIILHNIRVLAVSLHVHDERDAKLPLPALVTLAVTPRQAERLTRALEQGTIKLIVLRDDDETGDSPGPASTPAPTGLYTDAEIRKLAKFDIDKASQAATLGAIPCLEVVPAGESRPRGEVFKALGIEDARVRDFRTWGKNFVVFLEWQVSPSYDISCMTGENDPDTGGLEMTDPKRKVYGIRLLKRHNQGQADRTGCR